MTTLEDRLAALADDAPQAGVAPGLWERGLSLHRRRRRGTVAILTTAVVALSALGVASWRMADVDPAPASPGDGLRLPDQFFTPSQWLPGTDDEGPIGRLIAVVGAERSAGANGLVGVSATGEYRFLDLPSRAVDDPFGDADVALSADGSRIGYWYESADSVEGVAVYDTVTGRVDRLAIDSDHGLQMESLVWSGDRLWFEVYRKDDASGESATGDGLRVWDLASGDVTVHARAPSLSDATPVADGLVVGSGRRLNILEPTPSREVRTVRLDRPVTTAPVFAPGGELFAAPLDDDGPVSSDTVPSPVLVGRLGDDGLVRLTEVPDLETNELLGWRDATHVVAFSYQDPAYYSIDIRTGESERLSEPAPNNWSPGTRVALDAWSGPVFDAPEPPSPMDPRLRFGLGLVVVALAGLAMWSWRRRVRP